MGRREDLERRQYGAGHATAIDAATRLAEYLAAGGVPAAQACSIRLDAGEHSYGETTAGLWQYWGHDSYFYNVRGIHPQSGLTAHVIAGARNDAAERRARTEAAPQWRSLGTVPVIATNTRVLACRQGQWITWSYPTIRQVAPDPENLLVDLYFDGGVPTRLAGTSAPWLTVLLVYLLHGQILTPR